MDSRDFIMQRLKLAEKKINILVNLSSNMVFEYDIQADTIYYYNETSSDGEKKFILNFIGSNYLMEDVHPEDQDKIADLHMQLTSGKQFIKQRFRRLIDGQQYRTIEVVGQTLYNEKGEILSVIGQSGMVNHSATIYNSNMKGFDRDLDTGVYNKSTIIDLLQNEIDICDYEKDNFLIMLDCSKFIEMNDKLSTTIRSSYTEEMRERFYRYSIGRYDKNKFIFCAKDITLASILEEVSTIDKNMNLVYVNDFKVTDLQSQIGIVKIEKAISLQKSIRHCYSALQFASDSYQLNYCVFDPCVTPIIHTEELKQKNIEYTSTKSLHELEDDLIYFTMELTEQVDDSKSVLRILSEKIARLYHIGNFAYFTIIKEKELNIRYIWDKNYKGKFVNNKVTFDVNVRKLVQAKYDNQGIAIFREQDMTNSHKDVKSAICIRLDDSLGEHFMVFYDYSNDRTWEWEKQNLRKMSWIMHRRIRRLEDENRRSRELNYKLEHDDKTDLYKYSRFLEIVEEYVLENTTKKFALIYSDFSNFQFLNETYGYITGDKVLIEFANILKNMTVLGNMCARVTGDHFISLHEYSEDLIDEYENLCKRFSGKINSKYELCNIVLVSGLCVINDLSKKMAYYVDNANIARKLAKKNKITNCMMYSGTMRKHTKMQMELIANMEKALENNEFKMYLQPKIDLVTGKVSGAEALVRWIKADGEMVVPDNFIPIFEENGFVTKIDFEIFRQTLLFQKEIMDSGQPLMPISVNFSRRHQENPLYVEKVHDLMVKYGVPSEAIEIEITESVFVQDLTRLTDTINSLKEKGVKIAIDDFGSGYSSLNVLTLVNADVIKLDREFILDMQKTRMATHVEFLKTLIIMLKQLGFKVLAEGVETKEQESMLRGIGCEYAQGYLYARPMTPRNYLQYATTYKSDF